MRCGELFTKQTRPPFPDPDAADPETIRQSFVHTLETDEICGRILERLAAQPATGLRGFLFAGAHGVGKTHLLRYLQGLLADPDSQGWRSLEARLPRLRRPSKPVSSVFVQLPVNPDRSVESALIESLGHGEGVSVTDPFEATAAAAIARVADDGAKVIVVDGLSRRIDWLEDPSRAELETRTLALFTALCGRSGVLAVVSADERHLRRKRTSDPRPPLESLTSANDVLWMSQNNIAEVIYRALAPKDGLQRQKIRTVLAALNARLPQFDVDEEAFLNLYPLAPETFEAAFRVRALLPSFSPLDFAQSIIANCGERPASSPAVLSDLFDSIAPQLRKTGRFSAIMAAYEDLRLATLPMLRTVMQPKGEALLKGVLFATAFGGKPATPVSLAHSLLLYDETETIRGYGLASALLEQIEAAGVTYLAAEGSGAGRSYRLTADATRVPPEPHPPDRGPASVPGIPALLFDWIEGEVPSWKPERSPHYMRNSQVLAAPLPGGTRDLPGIVYFKSVLDPPWNDHDVAAVRETTHPWVLLVLDPFERFFELESVLNSLAERLDRLLIWRPDAPSTKEASRLRGLARQLTGAAPVGPADSVAVARNESRWMLRTLYVDRGQLLSRGSHTRLGAALGTRTVADYLAGRLAEAAPPSAAPAPVWSAESRPGEDESQRALTWTSQIEGLLSAGPEEVLRSLSPLPEPLMTNAFWKEVCAFKSRMESLRAIWQHLEANEIGPLEAGGRFARLFNGDEDQFRQWRGSCDRLLAFSDWVPTLLSAREYVLSAFPTARKEIDDLRDSLRRALDNPHTLLDADARGAFEATLNEFKSRYREQYGSLHESALDPGDGQQTRVDVTGLRNLELLSRLPYVDKSHYHRVRVLARWLQRHQCRLPVREILERQPRCYCNFNPTGGRLLTDSARELNAAIAEGVEAVRERLRGCGLLIVRELQRLGADDQRSQPIAALLSHGPAVPVTPESADILSRIIQANAVSFQQEFRSSRPGVTQPGGGRGGISG